MSDASERENVIAALREFTNLKHDWDSYGSPPPAKEIVEEAVRYVASLPDLPLRVAPLAGGGVVVWREGWMAVCFEPYDEWETP